MAKEIKSYDKLTHMLPNWLRRLEKLEITYFSQLCEILKARYLLHDCILIENIQNTISHLYLM